MIQRITNPQSRPTRRIVNPRLWVGRAGNTHMKFKKNGRSSDVYVPLYARQARETTTVLLNSLICRLFRCAREDSNLRPSD